MSLAADWREKHCAGRSRGRLFFYILLLLITVFFMLSAGDIVQGFSSIFFRADSTSAPTEELSR